MNTIRIAIDGPSGAGKSTLARSAAGKLGYLYVDTGAIYRTVGYYAHTHRIDPKDEAAVTACLPEVTVELAYGRDGLQCMLLNGEDVTAAIRLPEISLCASAVSAHPGVRGFLLEMQRKLAREHSVIMDGRDIGTEVSCRRSRSGTGTISTAPSRLFARQRMPCCWTPRIWIFRRARRRCFLSFGKGRGAHEAIQPFVCLHLLCGGVCG